MRFGRVRGGKPLYKSQQLICTAYHLYKGKQRVTYRIYYPTNAISYPFSHQWLKNAQCLTRYARQTANIRSIFALQ